MISVAVIGANGYVGSALLSALTLTPGLGLSGVTHANYAKMQAQKYDILINAAMPSRRYWAKNNPEKDFVDTVQKTADLIYGWRFGKLVQISTVSARCQLDTVYGRHKAAAEKICLFGDNLIIRLGPMYSRQLGKGVLIDMLQDKKVFVDADSRYCFAPMEFVASWIANNLNRTGIVEVGARNSITLREVARHLGGHIEFKGPIDHQEIPTPEEDYPDAYNVLAFMDAMRKQILTEQGRAWHKRSRQR